MRATIPHGPGQIEVELPDDRVVSPSTGVSVPMDVVDDLEDTYRSALADPVDSEPLRDWVKQGAKVTIAFDDPTVQQYSPVWEVALPLVIAELEAGGVARDNIDLICANALHRQFTHDELAKLIGPDIVSEFGPRLRCHDAEDPDGIVDLGTTAEHGYAVQLNRCVEASDVTVYLNCAAFRGFSGGWKSVCVGLSTFASISHHHNPDDMSMSIDRNRMHAMLDEMGAHTVERLGDRRIFKVETVQANPLQVSKVFAGTVHGTRKASLDLMRAHTTPRRDLVQERVDVVLYGLPDWSPYAAYSHTNPILNLVSTGLGYMGGVIEAFGKPGCTVIIANPCPPRWNTQHHPSYPEVWERILPETKDPYEIRERFESDFASRGEYVDAYRNRNGFHGVHAIMAIFPLKRLKHAGRVLVVGAEDPSVPRHLGFEAFDTVEEALAEAEQIHGGDCSIACVRYPQASNRA